MEFERRGRLEDRRLLTGRGQFGDDYDQPGALHAHFVRADLASARLLGLDLSAARDMPGVVAIFTGEDMAADGVGPVQPALDVEGPDGRKWAATPRQLLPTDRVRHVGEPLAVVIADTAAQARDAAEAVSVSLEETGAVTSLPEAIAPGAPRVHDDRPGNLCAQWARGDWEEAGRVIAESAVQVRRVVPISRVSAAPMEPRNVIAGPAEEGRMEIVCSHQNPMALRPALAAAFGLAPEEVHVHSTDVGGAFGMKAGPLREEFVAFWAARRLGRHVRWSASRSEAFLCDDAARDMEIEAELGMDEDGTFRAMRFHMRINVGAYGTIRSMIPMANFGGVAGVYRTPVIAGKLDGILTHTVPTAPYRGAGRPEATMAVETLIDAAARQAGIDPVTLRRRNLIPASAMPWSSPFIFDYDCGDFERVLDTALEQADVAGFADRRAASEARGRRRGLGVVMCIETAGGMYHSPGQDFSNVEIRADGTVTLDMGTFSTGSGLETAMTQVAARMLELPEERLRYRQGDTDLLTRGRGMGGSAGMAQGTAALGDAVKKALDKARAVASEVLEADVADIDYRAGRFEIVGTDRTVTLEKVAEAAAERGVRLLGEGSFAPKAPTFPNAAHVCEVEVDPETGATEVLRYTAVEDIGTVVNPQLAQGQIHGGVAQGLGQALCEELRYDPEDGQLLTGSLMDYAIPRATDLPPIECGFRPVPTKINPLGVKGVGEAGCVGGLAAGMSAVGDALAGLGVERFDMPATPGRVWAAIREAAAGSGARTARGGERGS